MMNTVNYANFKGLVDSVAAQVYYTFEGETCRVRAHVNGVDVQFADEGGKPEQFDADFPDAIEVEAGGLG